jgi:cytochrome c peroxidase
MHNGAFTTLEQVIDFYDQGAGAGQVYTVDNIDARLRTGPLHLTAQEKQQLLVFLTEGLTDLSKMPQVPSRVPSGLAVPPVAK